MSKQALTRDVAEVRRIVLAQMRGRARAYLYGSWARGQGTRTSDIDVGIMPLEPLAPSELSQLRQKLEDSNVLLPVDIVDLSRTDAVFRKHVMQDAMEWTD